MSESDQSIINSLELEIEKLINELFDFIDNSDHLRKHDRLVEKFFNYCVEECNKKDGKLETMFVVSVLLPKIISGPYHKSVTNLMKKLTYRELPSNSFSHKEFTSTREHLWSYSYHYYKFPDEQFQIPQPRGLETCEEVEKHTAKLCYVPLPGLCTHLSAEGKVVDVIFPYKQNPFVKLAVCNPIDYSLNSKTSLELFSSPPFQAIVKFRWHAFARWCFLKLFFIHLITIILFTMALYIKSERINKIIWIINMIWGVILTLIISRSMVTVILMNLKEKKYREIKRYVLSPVTYFIVIACCLPFVTSFLEYNEYFNLEPLLNFGIKLKPFFRSTTICCFWLYLIVLSISIKNLGVFVIVVVQICRRIVWLLIFLGIILFTCAHTAMVYLSLTDTDKSDESLVISTDNNQTSYRILNKKDIVFTEGDSYNENYKRNYSENYIKENSFENFVQSLKNFWSMILGDYSSLEPWDGNDSVYGIKIIYSLFVNILILNVLIALVNKAYEEVLADSYTKWTIIRAYIIVYMEILFIPRKDENYFPYTIAYEAFIEEVEKENKKNSEEGIKKDPEEGMVSEEERKKDSDDMDKIQGQIQKLLEKIQKLLERLKKKENYGP